jgi:rubrerythrin
MSDVEQEQTEQTEPEPETDEPGVSDDEAAEAEEAEQAEQEPPDEPVARSENELQLERRRVTAEKKWAQHEKRVREIYAEESEYLYPCPLCPDQHRGLIDIRFAGMVPDELADAVYAYVRGSEQVKYRQAQNVAECPVCGGNGKVLSGSKVAGKDLITCVSCKGFGYVPPPSMDRNGNVEEALVPVAVGGEGEPVSNEDIDIWGSPHWLADGQENSNYGKMPQYKDPRLP